MAKLSELLTQIAHAEDIGNIEEANALRKRVEDAGYGDRLPEVVAPPAPPPAPEESFLDNWGRPIAEAGGSLIGGALGLPGGIPGMMVGAGLGGELAGRGMDYLGGDEQLGPKETVMSTLFNSMGGPTPSPGRAPQALAGLVPEGGLFDYGKAATGGMEDLIPHTPLDQAESAVRARGGMLTPGQKGSPAGQRIEASLEQSAFGSKPIQTQRSQSRNIFGDMVEESVPLAGSRETVGEAATAGYGHNIDYGQAVVHDSYKALDDVMAEAGGDQRISMESLQEVMAEYDHLVSQDAGFGELIFQDPDLMRSMSAMRGMLEAGQQPTYDTIKQLRTLVGKKAANVFGTGEKLGLQKLYRALTNDLDAGAFEVGGEAALKARKLADSNNTKLMRDIATVDPIFKNADNPTAVYKAVAAALVNNPRLAADAKIAMGPNAWDKFADSWINMAAMPTPGNASMVGDFSENTFLTTMNRLRQQSPEGYKLLTEGKEAAMETLEALAGAIKQGDSKFNRSNTAGALGTQQLAQSLIGGGIAGGSSALVGGPTTGAAIGIGSAAANIILQKLSAAVLTSPRMSKAVEAIGAKYGDRLPIGKDLARALVSAGADSAEIKEIFGDENGPS